jgi:Aerotolerance regulator N-terminal.
MGELGTLLAPWQWAIMAALPVLLVLLYFLKLKRHPVEVPSTYLWKKSIEDLHVNSIWQRLRRNLLLFLQLLVLLLAIFALLIPYWGDGTTSGERYIFFD